MPAGDRTGPQGLGPTTGRAAGYCTGNPVPGYMNFGGGGCGRGGGFGGGRRGGRGYRNRYYATGIPGWARGGRRWSVEFSGVPHHMPPTEQGFLKAQTEHFENALKEIKKRLQELEVDRAQR